MFPRQYTWLASSSPALLDGDSGEEPETCQARYFLARLGLGPNGPNLSSTTSPRLLVLSVTEVGPGNLSPPSSLTDFKFHIQHSLASVKINDTQKQWPVPQHLQIVPRIISVVPVNRRGMVLPVHAG